jgi:hypothetical protein
VDPNTRCLALTGSEQLHSALVARVGQMCCASAQPPQVKIESLTLVSHSYHAPVAYNSDNSTKIDNSKQNCDNSSVDNSKENCDNTSVQTGNMGKMEYGNTSTTNRNISSNTYNKNVSSRDKKPRQLPEEDDQGACAQTESYQDSRTSWRYEGQHLVDQDTFGGNPPAEESALGQAEGLHEGVADHSVE